MDQLARSRAEGNDQLGALYGLICEDLARVEQIVEDALRSDHPFVDRLARYGFRLGGKRLRPALVLMAGLACGRIGPEHHLIGAVVEIIHTATLVHDDVLDDATLRRHLETMNARWDNEASILLGDLLFARAVRMASTLETPEACRAICRASEAMCEGELRQVERRGRFDLSEPEYIEIIAGKTAALIACCSRLGASYAGAPAELVAAMERFGYQLGVAFQIADDLLDLTGDQRLTGKSLGTDLLKQKPTLPVIRLLAEASDEERGTLLQILGSTTNHRLEALQAWFDRYDVLAYARARGAWFAEQAAAELRSLPPSPARDLLHGVTRYVIARQR